MSRNHEEEVLGGAHCARPDNGRSKSVEAGLGRSAADRAPTTDPAKAQKKDVGKIPVTQGFMNYFPRAILAVALVSEYGKRKYAPNDAVFNTGWREVPNGELRYADADVRHRLNAQIGGNYDEESEMAHLAHKAWNAMAELERALLDGRIELRVGNLIGPDGKPIPHTGYKV